MTESDATVMAWYAVGEPNACPPWNVWTTNMYRLPA